MYNTYTKSKFMLIAAIASSSIIFASSAMAGPGKGKPGDNDLAPGGNIVEVALAANDALDVFNTVLTAATCSYFEGAVVAILTGEDKVTLFAPVDTAFAELDLDQDNVCEAFDGSDDAVGTPSDLLGILAYHVSEGRRFSNSVFNRNGNAKSIDMLMGGSIITSEGSIYDNNMRKLDVVAPFFDINASNGVIHVVDRVMLP
jgi:uncharacterized surface protein with fasciclin (FAS1) repeats